MKALLLLTLILGSSASLAKDFIIGLGGGVVSKSESKETALTQNGSSSPVLRSYGGGFATISAQYIGLPLFDWVTQGQYITASGLSYYDYTDGNNHGVNERQKTTIGELTFALGPRLNLLSLGNLKFFAGGGGAAGSKVLVFDKTNYLERNSGQSTGFLDSDVAGQYGYYAEAGVEYRGAPLGFRIMAQHQEMKSGKFKTLDNSRINNKQQLYSFSLQQQI